MLDGINSQAASFAANQFQGRTEQSATVTPNSEHEEKVASAGQVRNVPGQEEVGADGRKRDSFELSQEAEEIRQLQVRDREVRAHEAAHASTGGSYAGGPSYSLERGPDGQSYAVGGEVSIDISPIAGDPQATIQKAQQVRAAALAPAEPSAQDMKVAQRAQSMAAEARVELAQKQSEELKEVDPEASSAADGETEEDAASSVSPQLDPQPSSNNISSGFARLSVQA